MHDACFCFGKGRPCINICAHKYVYWLAMEMSTNTNEHENNCNYRSIWEKINVMYVNPGWTSTTLKWNQPASARWRLILKMKTGNFMSVETIVFLGKYYFNFPTWIQQVFPQIAFAIRFLLLVQGWGFADFTGGLSDRVLFEAASDVQLVCGWVYADFLGSSWPGKRPWGRAQFEVASHVPLVVWVNVPSFFFESFWGATGLFNAMMQQFIWCLLLPCFIK